MLTLLATESGIPYTSPLAKLAVPLGFLIFLGGPYLLLRSNLGTKRGYLVLATSFFGLMLIISLFWAFGAPGTPVNTGPTNLPGQVADEYQPTWVSFAEDSIVAGEPPYAELVGNPDAFTEDIPEDQAANVATGVEAALSFFQSEEAGDPVGDAWAVAEGPAYAVADNGQPVIRVVFAETFQLTPEGELPEDVREEDIGQVNPDGERFVAYAFFDAGSPFFPSLVVIVTSAVLFALHAFLLHRDEQRERREAREAVVTEREQVPAGA
jgi:hypothetical protein